MVVLTIVTEKNGETIFFADPIPQVHFIKLISCSLYNSWDTLKKEGSADLGDIGSGQGASIGKIPPGHYSLEHFANEIKDIFKTYNYKLATETNTPFGLLKIVNLGTKHITLDHDLANLLGLNRKLKYQTTYVKRLTSPTAYFIHCDLIDKTQNLFNRRRSDLLAVVDVKGKPYEKATYHSSPQQVLRECATDKFINSITLSVKDENGELFDFKGFPLCFELELN